jgi:predicted HicB family RNase H-like nuclease
VSSTLKYKDYQGSVAFEDGQLIIQILHIDDFITTECDSAAGAQQAFVTLVDDYLAACREMNKEPSKPFKGSFNVRVSPNLHRSVALAAVDANETMNAWIASVLQEKIDHQKSAKRMFDPHYISRLTEGVAHHYEVASSSFEIMGIGEGIRMIMEPKSFKSFFREENHGKYFRKAAS